jgi:hypothetical protein
MKKQLLKFTGLIKKHWPMNVAYLTLGVLLTLGGNWYYQHWKSYYAHKNDVLAYQIQDYIETQWNTYKAPPQNPNEEYHVLGKEVPKGVSKIIESYIPLGTPRPIVHKILQGNGFSCNIYKYSKHLEDWSYPVNPDFITQLYEVEYCHLDSRPRLILPYMLPFQGFFQSISISNDFLYDKNNKLIYVESRLGDEGFGTIFLPSTKPPYFMRTLIFM